MDNGRVVGIISRRDIKPIMNSDAQKKVREFMTEEVVTIAESTSPEEAWTLLTKTRWKDYPWLKTIA